MEEIQKHVPGYLELLQTELYREMMYFFTKIFV